MPIRCLLSLVLLLVTACSLLPAGRGDSRPAGRSARAGPGTATPGVIDPQAAQCFARLGRAGVAFTPLPNRYIAPNCTNLSTVQLRDLPTDDARLAIGNIGPVTCAVSQVFADWARYGADRAARQILGSPLRSIETFGSYSCRDVAGTGRRSAHASAAAIDISAFVLKDGRRITVRAGWNKGNEAERQFLRAIHQSACRRFATVLGPNYNLAHQDHLHVERVLQGRGYCR